MKSVDGITYCNSFYISTPSASRTKLNNAQGVSHFLDKLNKFASYSFILAVSLYTFAGKGIQGVKATDQNTPHLSGVLFLLQEQVIPPSPKLAVFFFF